MKRYLIGIGLIAVGFLGGLLAQQPAQPPRAPDFSQFARRIPVAFDTVVSVQGNTLVVQAAFGENTVTRTVTVSNNAQIQRSQPATRADIKPNTVAVVQGQPDPQTGWLRATTVVVMPHLPREGVTVVGRVYDVKGGGSQFGVSAPVLVNPDARVFKMTPIKLADLKPGERVFVRGRPDAQGNLVAETIVAGEMPPFGGFGGGRTRGFGQGPRRERAAQR